MIFNKDNLKESSKSRGFRRYDWTDGRLLIFCHGRLSMGHGNKSIQYWVCKPVINDTAKEFLNFSFAPPWNEKKFYQGLERSLITGGKYKLIRAMYNDFEA